MEQYRDKRSGFISGVLVIDKVGRMALGPRTLRKFYHVGEVSRRQLG